MNAGRPLILLVALLGALVSSADANWAAFLPKLYERSAEVRVYGSYDKDENRVAGRLFGWDDSYLREKFTVRSLSYVYDPRFLQCRLSLSGVLRQEKYTPFPGVSTGWNNSTGIEYEARAFFLPEHAYNLNLFALRFEPLFKEHSAVAQNTVDTSNGVEFRYRNKPYFLDSKFISDTINSNNNSTHVRTFSVAGTYFKEMQDDRLLSLSGEYNRPNFSDELGLDGHTDQASFSGMLRNSWLSFDSNISTLSTDQVSPFSGILESSQFSLLERLTAELPWNFWTDFRYQYQKNSNDIRNPGITSARLTSSLQEVGLDVSHHLYESLDSTYSIWRHTTDSNSGESSSLSQYGNVNYVKNTPWGVIQAGINLGRSDTESTGQPAQVNESHPGVRVPGLFTLNQARVIDPRTIRVLLASPLPPNELILLTLNVHYTIITSGDSFQINVFSLPPQFLIPETYDFQVSYALQEGDYTLRTDTFGYNLSYDAFRTIMPYFNYIESNQKLLSGFFPGALFSATTKTAGVTFRRYGFQALAEYQNSDWPVNPYTSVRFELRYSGSITPTTTIRASAEYLNKDYAQVEIPDLRFSYTDERTSVSGNIQKRLLSKTLLFSAGGSYSSFEGLVEGDAYSFDSSLSWRIAKLDFTLGATTYHSDVRSSIGLPYDRTRQYYFLNVGRQLF